MPYKPFSTVAFNKSTPDQYLGNVEESVVLPGGLRQDLFIDGDIDPNESDPRKKWKSLKLVQKMQGGPDQTLYGYDALLSAKDKNGDYLYSGEDPMYQASVAKKPGDIRNSMAWRLGKEVQNGMQLFKAHYPFKGPVGKTLTGAALGAGGLALGSWLLGRLGMLNLNPTAAGIIGAAGGGAFGLWQSGLKNKIPYQWFYDRFNGLGKTGSYMQKSATLYHDPRNFILEKLQRDTQLSMSDKAILAGKIRAMSIPEANTLERSVRSALGVGVGAIIANYFGLGPVGALMGGILGGLAANAMGIGKGMFSFADKPSLYNAFNQGGRGFDTYNQFFSLVNKGV